MKYWMVMPAAGVGRRFGEQRPKQYAPLRGRTVIEWALVPFLTDSRCRGVVVALAPGDPYWPEIERKLTGLPAEAAQSPSVHEPPTRVSLLRANGGTERSGSVRNGLTALAGRASAHDWVLVHDAARPCLPARDLARLLDTLETHPVGGLLATPAADTLKRALAARAPGKGQGAAGADAGSAGAGAGPGGASAGSTRKDHGALIRTADYAEVEQTVDRSGLWRALTPQMFRYARLCEALDQAAASGRHPTDEAQALEWLGERPVLVEGSASNIKITSADDLVLAEALLGARSS